MILHREWCIAHLWQSILVYFGGGKISRLVMCLSSSTLCHQSQHKKHSRGSLLQRHTQMQMRFSDTSDVTVLREYGCGSDGVITFQKNKLQKVSTPCPLWSLVTRKRLIWENHKLSMMPPHPPLSADVNLSRKLSQLSSTPGLLLCVLWLGLNSLTKMDQHAQNVFCFSTTLFL